MKNFKQLFLFILCFSVLSAMAQNGTIRGTIFDEDSGEAIPFAKVLVEGMGTGANADMDGKFSINIVAGTYSLKLSAGNYNQQIVQNVIVVADEVTLLDNLSLSNVDKELGTVVVTVEAIKNTENAILKIKQKRSNQIDAISGKGMAVLGTSNAATTLATVPGVSIVGGKYVYIRGLGDRYNKTLLNGMDIPGLDPDRNTIQMDIFPTNILENIIINKSFIAELPADFTGGVIDIALKGFPEKRQRSVSLTGSYNPAFHFQKEYLTYDGGQLDFLGFDNGTRAIPATKNIPFFAQAIGSEETAARYKEVLAGFNPTMAAYEQMSLMDFGVSTSFGNQFNKEKYTIGYNVVASYKNSTDYYKNVEFGRFGLAGNSDSTNMQVRERQTGSYGTNNVLMTGMAGFAVKTLKSKYTFNLLHLQNGESKAGVFNYLNSDQGAVFNGYQHNLEYSQRSLTNLLFSGEHSDSANVWSIEWRVAPTLSLIKDPDIRFTRYENRNDSLIIGTEAGFPERIWRELNEKNIASKVGATKKIKVFKRDANIKFGTAYTYKVRDFIIRNFALNVRDVNLTGDPDELFAPENIWPQNGDITKGTTYEASFLPSNPNKYNSNIHSVAGYFSTEFNPWKRVKTVIGLRVENYTQRYTGQDQLGVNVFNNDVVLNDLGFYPSLNVVYAVNEKQNLRFSYGGTTARPSFKELSYAEIYDPVTGRTFIGGLFKDEDINSGQVYWDGQLTSTDIHNIDVRWEIFPKPGRIVSVTGFYKRFINPIEIVQFSAQTGSFQPRNVGDGEVLGGEFEIRQSLDVVSKKMQNLSFNLNLTYTSSRIAYSLTEKESREANARTGHIIGDYRDMAGQAPYLINAGLIFGGAKEGFGKGLSAGLFYNMQGPTLQFVGIVDRPDIYSVPFHSLNFNTNKVFGKNEQFVVGFKVQNILNDKKEAVFRSFNANDQYFSKLSPGTTFSARFKFNF